VLCCFARTRVVVAGVIIVLVLLASAERRACAGRSRFGWLYDVDTIPERSVELETWLIEEDGPGAASENTLWTAPVIGVTDRLELALPVELDWDSDGTTSNTRLARLGAELRWRLVSTDPVDAPAFVPLVRLGVKRLLDQRDGARVEPGVVLGFDAGRVHLGLDAGVVLDVGQGHSYLTVGLGTSVRLTDDLRVGAEGYLERNLQGGDASWIAAGPNLSWTHGRFWLTLVVPVGLHNLDAAPRLNWAVAL